MIATASWFQVYPTPLPLHELCHATDWKENRMNCILE